MPPRAAVGSATRPMSGGPFGALLDRYVFSAAHPSLLQSIPSSAPVKTYYTPLTLVGLYLPWPFRSVLE
jgi:hypothetical protein